MMFAFINPLLPWWAWALALAVPPAVLMLYFLKLKRKPLQVPSTYLWQKSVEDLHVNSLLQRLRQNLLLFLQLFALLLAILALLGPNWEGSALQGKRFIFLLDTSASMRTTDQPGDRSRFEEAKSQLDILINALPSGSEAMLITFADRAKLIQGYTRDKVELKRRLATVRPTQRSTDISRALQRATDSLEQVLGEVTEESEVPQSAVVYVLTDGRFPDPKELLPQNLRPELVVIGDDKTTNFGITAMQVTRSETRPDEAQLFLRVNHFGPPGVAKDPKPHSVPLEVWQNGVLVHADDLEVPPNGAEATTTELPDFPGGTLEVRIDAEDPFSLDDVAWAALNPPKPGVVLLVTPGNDALEWALNTKPAKKLVVVTTIHPDQLKSEKYRRAAQGRIYDLVIYDRCSPKTMPRANTFFLGSLPPTGWTHDGTVKTPQIVGVDGSHPLMQFVNPRDQDTLIVKAYSKLAGPEGTKELIKATSGPLMALAPSRGYQDLVCGFALRFPDTEDSESGTNWLLQPSFTNFMFNLLKSLGRGGEVVDSLGVLPGTQISLTSQLAEDSVQIVTPDGDRVKLSPTSYGRYVFTDTERVGLYTIDRGETEDTNEHFAVNLFDARESNITPAEPDLGGPTADSADQGPTKTAARHQGWKYLLIAVLGVLIAEWYIYNRRLHL